MARDSARIAVCVLAAGAARRMAAPKLLLPFKGSTLLDRVLAAASKSSASTVLVVTGAYASAMQAILQKYSVRPLYNPRWANGQATSIQTAATFCRSQGFDALLVTVADQPFLTHTHFDALISAYRQSQVDGFICAAQGRRGSPCLFSSRCFAALEALVGDNGARSIPWGASGFAVQDVSFANAVLFADVDTVEDLRRLEGIGDDGICGDPPEVPGAAANRRS